jgi:hypothetical protein
VCVWLHDVARRQGYEIDGAVVPSTSASSLRFLFRTSGVCPVLITEGTNWKNVSL